MSKEIQLGIFFFIALVILGVVFELLNGIPFLQRHYTLKTYFSAIGELKPGNPVKLAGLEVGKVSAVKLGNNNIAVEIEIERGTPVKKDSVATIKLTSLLGISYVNVSFGSPESPLAKEGDVLKSEEQADINRILSKLESTISAFDFAIGENKDKINNILGSLDTILGNAAEGKGTIGKLLNDDTLYTQAAEAATNLNEILKRINRGEGTIGKLVTDDTLYFDALNITKKLEKTLDTQEDLAPLQTISAAFGIITLF